MADAAKKALFVPVLVRGEFHKVSVFDFLAASFADFLRLFAFDGTNNVCKSKRKQKVVRLDSCNLQISRNISLYLLKYLLLLLTLRLNWDRP